MTEIDLSNIILSDGAHSLRSQGMCVAEAVAWLAGEPHSDHPACLCPVIGEFLRIWNDELPSDAERTRLLGPLLPRLVGTRADAATELRRAYLALDWLVRVHAPAWLDLVPTLTDYAAVLRALPPLLDVTSTQLARSESVV